jgi:hypothetical protein
MSTSVSIFNPPVPVGVASAAVFAANVNPEQVILTAPANTIDLTVILIVSVVKAVTEASTGLGTSSQLVAVATAVSKEVVGLVVEGNVNVIFLSTAISVDILKVNVAV